MEESELLKSEGFEIIKTLGRGSFGSVFHVFHPELGEVAAKVVDNSDFNEFEWDVAGILNKELPNERPFIINNILAKGFLYSTVIIVEYANLGNLKSIVDTNIDLPIPIIRAIMNQLLEGISYLHSKRIIHRDIKSANILLHNPPGSGRVICKIADFGAVKVRSTDDESTYMRFAGTHIYMPPEIFLGDENELKKADEKVDIWSLAMLFFKLITHTFPFETPSMKSIYLFMTYKVLNRPESFTDDLLWDLLVRMLEFDRKDRISAEIALEHPFFTGEEAMKEITPEENQLAQTAEEAIENGDENISQFDTIPSFIFPLTEVEKILSPIDPEDKMNEIESEENSQNDEEEPEHEHDLISLEQQQQQQQQQEEEEEEEEEEESYDIINQQQHNDVFQYIDLRESQDPFISGSNFFGVMNEQNHNFYEYPIPIQPDLNDELEHIPTTSPIFILPGEEYKFTEEEIHPLNQITNLEHEEEEEINEEDEEIDINQHLEEQEEFDSKLNDDNKSEIDEEQVIKDKDHSKEKEKCKENDIENEERKEKEKDNNDQKFEEIDNKGETNILSELEAKIECDECHKIIPFSQYEEHFKFHVADRAEKKKPNESESESKKVDVIINPIIFCDICGTNFSIRTIESHLIKEHDRREPVECETCDKFIYLKHYKMHSLFHTLEDKMKMDELKDEKIHDSKLMICEICRIEVNPKHYYFHLKKQHKLHPDKKDKKECVIECRECKDKYNYKHYAEHLYAHKLVRKQMLMNDESIQIKENTIEVNIPPIQKNSIFLGLFGEKKRIECKYCRDMPIILLDGFAEHNNDKHQDNPIVQCEICKKYYLSSELLFHKQIHEIFQ